MIEHAKVTMAMEVKVTMKVKLTMEVKLAMVKCDLKKVVALVGALAAVIRLRR